MRLRRPLHLRRLELCQTAHSVFYSGWQLRLVGLTNSVIWWMVLVRLRRNMPDRSMFFLMALRSLCSVLTVGRSVTSWVSLLPVIIVSFPSSIAQLVFLRGRWLRLHRLVVSQPSSGSCRGLAQVSGVSLTYQLKVLVLRPTMREWEPFAVLKQTVGGCKNTFSFGWRWDMPYRLIKLMVSTYPSLRWCSGGFRL